MFNLLQVFLALIVLQIFAPRTAGEVSAPAGGVLAAVGAVLLSAIASYMLVSATLTAWHRRDLLLRASIEDPEIRADPGAVQELAAHSRELAQRCVKDAVLVRLLADALVLLLFATLCAGFDWPAAVRYALGVPDGLDVLPALAPWLAMMCAAWASLRRLDEALRGRPWKTLSYIAFHMRGTLFALIPVLLIGAASWAITEAFVEAGMLFQSYIFLHLAAVLVLVQLLWFVIPPVLRLLLPVERLRDEALLARLRGVAQRAGVHVNGIFIWRTGEAGLHTGFFIGLLPPFRYVFLTDALVRDLPPDEIEAVFAHELGHARHHHLWLMMAFLVTIMLFNVVADQYVTPVLEALARGAGHDTGGGFAFFTTLVPLLAAIYFGLGYFSRRLERQADFFAADRVGTAPMAAALMRIGGLTGGIYYRRGWRHFSIARRVSELGVLTGPPEQARAARGSWHRELLCCRWALAIAAVLCAVLAVPLVIADVETGHGTYAFLRAEALRVDMGSPISAPGLNDEDLPRAVWAALEAASPEDAARARAFYRASARHFQDYSADANLQWSMAFDAELRGALASFMAGDGDGALEALRERAYKLDEAGETGERLAARVNGAQGAALAALRTGRSLEEEAIAAAATRNPKRGTPN